MTSIGAKVGAPIIVDKAGDLYDAVKGKLGNSTVDASIDHEMIGQNGPTYDDVIEPSKFDETALEGQARQQKMLDNDTGYNVSGAAI